MSKLGDLRRKTIETMAERSDKDFVLISETNRASSARLVWFVAIAGFSLINISTLAEAITGSPVEGLSLMCLALPWSGTALFGILAHWALGDLMAKEKERHIVRMHDFYSFLVTAGDEPSEEKTLAIIRGDDKDVKSREKAVKSLFPWVLCLERLTFICLCFAFVWSIIFPFFLFVIRSVLSFLMAIY